MRKLMLFLLVVGTLSGLRAQTAVDRWQSDIALLKQELPARQPHFYDNYPREAWEANLDRIASRLGSKSDLQIALELQSVLARARDAHTRLDLTKILQVNRIIPIAFGWYKEGLSVSATVQTFEQVLGRQVLAVNDIPVEKVMEQLDMFVGSENVYGLRRDAHLWLRFPVAFRMAGISTNDTLVLTLDRPGMEPEKVPVYPPTIHSGSRNAMMPAQIKPENPDLRWRPVTMGSVFDIVWEGASQVLYVRYNYCIGKEMAEARGDSLTASQLPAFRPVMDTIIQVLENNPDARLFFDLRFNRGGDPADGVLLSQVLGANPALNSKERLFVAFNSYTATAPALIAQAFRENTMATLIGDPTGERPYRTSGEEGTFNLPNSGVIVIYAKTPPNSAQGKRLDALYPDVLLEMTFDAFSKGRDPLLDYVRTIQP